MNIVRILRIRRLLLGRRRLVLRLLSRRSVVYLDVSDRVPLYMITAQAMTRRWKEN